jgi:hypothetical protein
MRGTIPHFVYGMASVTSPNKTVAGANILTYIRILAGKGAANKQDHSRRTSFRCNCRRNGCRRFGRGAAANSTCPMERVLRLQSVADDGAGDDGTRNDGGRIRQHAANALRHDVRGSSTLQFNEQPVAENPRYSRTRRYGIREKLRFLPRSDGLRRWSSGPNSLAAACESRVSCANADGSVGPVHVLGRR